MGRTPKKITVLRDEETYQPARHGEVAKLDAELTAVESYIDTVGYTKEVLYNHLMDLVTNLHKSTKAHALIVVSITEMWQQSRTLQGRLAKATFTRAIDFEYIKIKLRVDADITAKLKALGLQPLQIAGFDTKTEQDGVLDLLGDGPG